MKLGIVGLGRMGFAIATRVVQAGHEVIGFDTSADVRDQAKQVGISPVEDLIEVARQADVIWLMVPAGDVVDSVINQIRPHCKPHTIIIDGGNSKYTDSMRRAQELQNHDIAYLDCGTSGGVHGLKDGFCLMVGGDAFAYKKVEPFFHAIAAPNGVEHVGPSGAGHYVKMVHNGIEYGLLQAYAEGFHIIKKGSFKDADIDLEKLTALWQSSSVVRSWLLDLAHNVFEKDQHLTNISGEVAEGGTGLWTLEEAEKQNIPAPVLEQTLKTRRLSRETGGNYTTKMIAMLRQQFGGHAVGTVDK